MKSSCALFTTISIEYGSLKSYFIYIRVNDLGNFLISIHISLLDSVCCRRRNYNYFGTQCMPALLDFSHRNANQKCAYRKMYWMIWRFDAWICDIACNEIVQLHSTYAIQWDMVLPTIDPTFVILWYSIMLRRAQCQDTESFQIEIKSHNIYP